MRGFLHFAPKCPYLKLRGGPVKKANCFIFNIRKMKKRRKENDAKLWPWMPWFPIFLISPRVVCATDKRAAGLVQRTQGGGRHIRLEDHQLYYYLEFCKGTMFLISVNLYIWTLRYCAHVICFGVENEIISIKRAKMCTNTHLLN